MAWELEEAITYYAKQGAPKDQTQLLNLLKEIQKENGGGIPSYLLAEIAQAYSVKESFLLAVIKRFPSLRLQDTHCLEVCAGPNCPKRAPLGAFVEKTWGSQPEKFQLKYVPCMRMCGKGPNIRFDGQIYHQADEALIRKLIEENT